MTRSVAGKNLTGRLVAASAAVAAIFTVSLLAGCSAGQIAATASVTSAVPGGGATVNVPAANNPNSEILLQNVTVNYNGPAGYTQGDDAPLSMNVVNQTPYKITVAADAGPVVASPGSSEPIGTMTLAGASSVQAATVATPSASGATPSVAPTASQSASSTPPVAPPSVPAAPAAVTVAPSALASLTPGADQYFQISNLAGPLQPGMVVTVALDFTAYDVQTGDKVGEYTADVTAPIAPPGTPAPRTSASLSTSGGNG